MDASHFHKPWIEKLLSTFEPDSVTSLPSERMHCLVAQVIKVKTITDQSDGVEIAGKSELHDNHLYVNAVFTKEAVQRFEKEEGEDGFSGAEFQDLKNSIITLKKYHVISRLHPDPKKSELLVYVEYFTLTHFDALPRVSRQPLTFACNNKNVASNILRLCRMQNESHSEPEQNSVVGSADSLSSPHLTQLLEEINKASQEEKLPPRRTFVFEITVSRPTTSDTGSSNGSDEDIQILNKALDEFERKLSIAKSLHHILGTGITTGQGSPSHDPQHFYDAPEFHIKELLSDTKNVLLDGFDDGDFEVPDISKDLETNAEWRADYVKSSCTQFGSKSSELIELRGGGVSSSSVEKRTDNKQTSEKPANSQAQSEVRSVDSDDWSMHSVESIGLTTDEVLANSQPDEQSDVEILNTSSGFQPAEFYTSPSSQGTSAGKKKHRPVAKLRSPQLPSSIPMPINSLPSHQPRNTKSSLPLSSQSCVRSGNCTPEREIESSSVEQLSNIKLEEEVLQWCTSHFLDMIEV